MSCFQPVALNHASRLLNHGPTVLITSADAASGRRNVMAAAWSTPVEFIPARIAIVVDKGAWSRDIIEQNQAFGICIPTAAIADLTWAVGSVSGREEDKFARYGIEALSGPELGLPVIEQGCAAWLECRLLPETEAQQRYDTLFGEVVSAAADARVYSEGRWRFSPECPESHTLHHLGAGTFVTSGPLVQAKPLDEVGQRRPTA